MACKTRKHRKSRKQRGGMTRNESANRSYFTTRIFNPQGASLNLRNFILNRTTEPNNQNYSWYKYTTIPEGTLFRFRSKERLDRLEPRIRTFGGPRAAIWVDYTESLGNPSFEVPNPNAPPEIARGMVNQFGPWLNTIRTLRPLKILHFPVDYSHVTASNVHSYTAEMEHVIQTICMDTIDDWDPNGICADGYTLDFLFTTPQYRNNPLLPDIAYELRGFRELAILNPQPGVNIELVSSVHSPVP